MAIGLSGVVGLLASLMAVTNPLGFIVLAVGTLELYRRTWEEALSLAPLFGEAISLPFLEGTQAATDFSNVLTQMMANFN